MTCVLGAVFLHIISGYRQELLKFIKSKRKSFSPRFLSFHLKRRPLACNQISSGFLGLLIFAFRLLASINLHRPENKRGAIRLLELHARNTNKLPDVTNKGNWEGRNSLSIINRIKVPGIGQIKVCEANTSILRVEIQEETVSSFSIWHTEHKCIYKLAAEETKKDRDGDCKGKGENILERKKKKVICS